MGIFIFMYNFFGSPSQLEVYLGAQVHSGLGDKDNFVGIQSIVTYTIYTLTHTTRSI